MSKLEGDPGYRDGWCIHYRASGPGGRPMPATCEAGVEYAPLRGPHQPCFLDKGESRAGALECPKLRRPTPEEIATHEAWSDGRTKMFMSVLAGIGPWRAKNKGKSASEIIECPACKGRLHLSISSYNGHVHGHCATKGCVSWME